MQPFARPVVRVAWGHARLGFDRAASRPGSCLGPVKTHVPAICVRCSIRAIGTRGRFYSSQIPPRDPERGPASTTSEKDPITEPEPTSRPSEQNPESAEPVQPKATPRSHELPSTTDSRRSDITAKFSEFMDNLQSRALTASQTLNDITGYSGIETIKRQNNDLEIALADAHERVRNARQAYKTSNTKRAATQREVTTLLARKDGWTPLDLERFTELYRADHVLEGEVVSSQESLTEAEAEEQNLNQRLSAGILKRYHEEQIWSDRIRRASTWGTWGLMGMNFVLFVVLQFVAEPWKRRRLVKGVVAEEKAVLEEVRGQLEEVKLALERREEAAKVAAPVELPAEVIEEAAIGEGATEPVELPEEVHAVTEEAPVAAVMQAVVESLQEPRTEPVPEPIRPVTSRERWEQCREFLLDPARWRAFAEDLYSERRVDLRMRDASILALEGAAAGAVIAGSVVLVLVRNR